MLFKSGKESRSHFVASAAALAVASAVASHSAHATVTVTPVTYGKDSSNVVYLTSSRIGPNPGTDNTVVTDQSAGFYPICRAYGFLNYLGAAPGSDCTTTAASNTANILEFDVSADDSFTVADQLLLSVMVKDTSGTYHPVPISFSRGEICTTQNTCQYLSNSYYYAARYPISDPVTSTNANIPIRVSIFLKDVCAAPLNGGSIDGCDTSVTPNLPKHPTAGTPTNFLFKFVIAPKTVSEVPGSTDGASSGDIGVRLKAEAPALTCPSLNNIYFPGDTEIKINPSVFSNTATSQSGAPVDTMIMSGAIGSPALPTSSAFGNNPIINRLLIASGEQTIGGFTNTTDGSNNSYQLYFTVRDTSGAVATFTSGCSLSNVRTSQIFGFLKKSNCFIATAAFSDSEAGPVLLLRQFRDQILLQSVPGRAFVRWYYAWSPDSARWLIENPVFRAPVLRRLATLEAIAYLALMPALFAALASIGLGLVAYSVFSNRFSRERAR